MDFIPNRQATLHDANWVAAEQRENSLRHVPTPRIAARNRASALRRQFSKSTLSCVE
jgi:hypothetical protein